MEEDLFTILEENQIKPETQDNLDNINLLKEEKSDLRSSSKILEEYTDLDLRKSEIEIEIDKFKKEHPEIFAILEEKNNEIQNILDKESSLKEELTKSMKEEGLTKLAGTKFQATYVAETTRTTFDKKAFETKYPVLCQQFSKVSPVSAYIKMSEVKK